jgi:hypothetical protein
MILRSEKKIKSDLQGSWQREFLGRDPFVDNPACAPDIVYYNVLWNFNGDNLYVIVETPIAFAGDFGVVDINKLDKRDTTIISKFKIDAKVLRAFIKLQLIDKGTDSTIFIDKWEFVDLDKNTLYLATDHPVTNTVEQREFFKIP